MTDSRNELVAEQLWSTVWLGVRALTSDSRRRAMPFRTVHTDRQVGSWQIDVDADMARRYAELSGDWSAHHFDAEAAQRSGASGPFLHGFCSMALCARALSEVVAGADQDSVGRIALRFAPARAAWSTTRCPFL